jgi:hypothetical protein
MDCVEWLLTIVGGLVLHSWCALNFLGKPLLKFCDLHNEVSARLAEFDNVQASGRNHEMIQPT